MLIDAFVPSSNADGSNTVNIAVTATSQTLTFSPIVPVGGGNLRLVNIGTQTVFVCRGTSTATTTGCMPILPNSEFVMTVSGQVTSLSVIAATTGSTLYASVGHGT